MKPRRWSGPGGPSISMGTGWALSAPYATSFKTPDDVGRIARLQAKTDKAKRKREADAERWIAGIRAGKALGKR